MCLIFARKYVLMVAVLLLLASLSGCEKQEKSVNLNRINSCQKKWLVGSSNLVKLIKPESKNLTLEFLPSSALNISKNNYVRLTPKSDESKRSASLNGDFNVILNLNSLRDNDNQTAFQLLLNDIIPPPTAKPVNNNISVIVTTRPSKGVLITDKGQAFSDMIGPTGVRVADDSLYQWQNLVPVSSLNDLSVRAFRQGSSLTVRISQNLNVITEKTFTSGENGNFFMEMVNTSASGTSTLSVFNVLWQDSDQGFFDDFSCTNFEQE